MTTADSTIEKAGKKRGRKSAADYTRERIKRDEERDAAAADSKGVTEEMLDRVDAGEEPRKIIGGTNGNGATIPASPSVHHVGLNLLVPTTLNPRFGIDQGRVRELAASMSNPTIGQLQYPIGRKIEGGKVELLTGRHRYEAAKDLGWQSMIVDVRDLTDQDAVKIVTLDNMQRKDMHPLEEAIGIDNMLKAGWSLAGIASQIGKGEAWVTRRHSLVKLSPQWQDAIRHPDNVDTEGAYPVKNYIGRLSAAHYERVARLPENVQESKFDAMVQYFHGRMHDAEEMENRLHDGDRRLDDAKFLSEDDEITRRLGDCSTCATCPKQTGAAPLLFHDETPAESKKRKGSAADQCLDGACWARKEAAFVTIRIEQAKAKHGDVVAVQSDHNMIPKAITKAVKKATGEAIVGQYSMEEVKKTDRGARPAIAVTGPKMGQTIYVKLKRPKPEASGTVDAATSKRELEASRHRHIANAVAWHFFALMRNRDWPAIPTQYETLLIAAVALAPRGTQREIIKKFACERLDGELCELLLRFAIDQINELDTFGDQILSDETAALNFLELLHPLPGPWDLDDLRAAAIAAFPDPAPTESDSTAAEASPAKSKKKSSKKKAKKTK